MKTVALVLLLIVIRTWYVNLPAAQAGRAYSAGLSEHLSGCAVNPDAKTSPATMHGLPSGLSVAANGEVSGTVGEAVKPAAYEFGVTCTEANFVARIKVLPKG